MSLICERCGEPAVALSGLGSAHNQNKPIVKLCADCVNAWCRFLDLELQKRQLGRFSNLGMPNIDKDKLWLEIFMMWHDEKEKVVFI